MRRAKVLWLVSIAAIVTLGAGGCAFREREELKRLANYEAPIFVWEKQVLAPGRAVSDVLKQAPIRLADGKTEENKAIQVRRGNPVGAQFVDDPSGKWFAITLLVDGQPKGMGSGVLLPEGFGTAIWCRDALTASEFNCYFRTTLQEDGGVKVRWTMLHSH
jgi:hypothetical protein